MQQQIDKALANEKTDKPLLGWICSYTPEEIITAAGFIPCRLNSLAQPPAGPTSSSVLPPNFCPFVRRLFDLAYSGQFKDIYGLVAVYSCDPMRRLTDAWSLYLNPGFLPRIDVPRRQDHHAEEYFLAQIKSLKKALEAEMGQKITEDDLSQSIKTLNTTRSLIQFITDKRNQSPYIIKARDFLSLIQKVQYLEKCQGNALLQNTIQDLDQLQIISPAKDDSKPRILVSGNIIEDPDFLDLIEQNGSYVVADTVCNYTRQYFGLIETTMDPCRAIARRYLNRPECFRMTNVHNRIQEIVSKAKESRCQGVICYCLKFCDLCQSDIPHLSSILRDEGIPLLIIERESLTEGTEQVRTRIEAFLEMLRTGTFSSKI